MKQEENRIINNPYVFTLIMVYLRRLRGEKNTLNRGRLKRQRIKNDILTAVNLIMILNLSNFLKLGEV
jgi:hypothetical protein